MAAYDFLHSRQGSVSLDEWVERLYKLAAKANFGAALDQLLFCQLLTGVADQRCRQELIRQECRTSREAIQFVRRDFRQSNGVAKSAPVPTVLPNARIRTPRVIHAVN